MYAALSNVLHSIGGRDQSIESWVVCLTDGMSDSVAFTEFHAQLGVSPPNLHIVVVGINLTPQYEQCLQNMCRKYDVAATDTKGFLVRSDGTTAGIDGAFNIVKSRIPVSQTFDRDGELSDNECRDYMAQFMPPFVEPHDMISQSFWIRFLYRRTQVFDRNKSFNYNESYDTLGSSLMEVMLSEVESLLMENQRRGWLETNHTQLIYDFTIPDAPEFRLVCTAPDELDPEVKRKLSALDLPGFRVPTKADLDRRASLDRFLSQALDVPLQTRDDGSAVLQCIDDHGFILTLDFTMKLLSIHERVACRVPCLIEGETGVSKTALTKMYSILRNSSLSQKARAKTLEDLDDILHQMESDGFAIAAASTVFDRLCATISVDADVADRALDLLRVKVVARPPWFAAFPSSSSDTDSVSQIALKQVEFFGSSIVEKTFFEINVDASLTERDFIELFEEVRVTADKLAGSDTTIIVFLDGKSAVIVGTLVLGVRVVLQFLLIRCRNQHIVRVGPTERGDYRSQPGWGDACEEHRRGCGMQPCSRANPDYN
jgi:hypothetical protein